MMMKLNTIIKKAISILLTLILIVSTFSILTKPILAAQSGDYTYELIGNRDIRITKYTGTETIVEIPTTIDVYDDFFNFLGSKNVREIGYKAFNGNSDVQEIIIPNSVASIDDSAFEDCTGLTSVTIGSSVISIGRGAFNGCRGLTQIIVDVNNLSYSNQDGVLFDKTKTSLIQCPGGKTGSYLIPNSVTSIGEYAFDGCEELTSVTIPNSVTSIGFLSFNGCRGLTSVIIGNRVISISEGSFAGCRGLTSVIIPDSVKSIHKFSFNGCTGLTQIIVNENNLTYSSQDGVLFDKTKTSLILFPGGKTGSYVIPYNTISIGEYAFSGRSGLTSVTIGNSVTSINQGAFLGCSGLTNVIIPDNVTSIGKDAFYGCTGLTSVTIGNSVISISGGAFAGCIGLTSVIIPNSVTSIGDSAFTGCSGLTSVTIPNSVTSIGNYAFFGCRSLIAGIFLGNAPSLSNYDVFGVCAPGFKIYYISGNTGFTNPWYGYTTTSESFIPPTATPTVTPTATPLLKSFPDVNKDNFVWAQESIEYLAELNIINGSMVDGQLMYLPANTITRAELCKLIVAAYEFTQNGQATAFTDTEGHWAVDYIAIASSQGIVEGYDDNTFKSDLGISREELAIMISRAMRKKNIGSVIPEEQVNEKLSVFLDQASINDWARNDVAYAVENGIIKGSQVEGGGFNFLPLDTANRAETAVMIKRAYDKLK